MQFTWIGDSYELMRFRRFVFLKHKVCIIKAVRFVMFIIQLTPHWGFSVTDYIKYCGYTYVT
jgi:hypothetical protein